MIHRVVSLPLTPSAFSEEVDLIKTIARLNGVEMDFDNIIRRKRVKIALDSTTSLTRSTPSHRDDFKWVRLPYLGQRFSSSISKCLKPYFRPAFYSGSSMSNMFCRLKDPIPKLERSGVTNLNVRSALLYTLVSQVVKPLLELTNTFRRSLTTRRSLLLRLISFR